MSRRWSIYCAVSQHLYHFFLAQINNLKRRELIVNGYDAKRGRYPYFVTIEDWCGGSLIAPDIVLTAGHCE